VKRDGLIVLVASLLATAPVWIPTFPPMTDLPQHASQVALLQAMLHGGFTYESSFHINWFTPYLLGYLLVYGLAPLVGIVTACKIIVAAALASLSIATALVMTETGTDRRFAILTIPAMYGLAYHWGFLNFLVAAPLGLVFLWLALRQARLPTPGGAIGLAAAINALFFCHALTCVFFGLIGGFILLLSGKTPGAAIRRILPLVSVVPVMILWGTRTIGNPLARMPVIWDLNWFTTEDAYYGALARWTTPGGWGWGRAAGMFPRLLGTRPGVLPTLVGLALFLLPVCAGARFTRRPALLAPLIVCLATLLFMPGGMFANDLLFQRFTIFALPLFLITLTESAGRPWPRWLWPACALVVTGWIGFVCANAIRYEADADGFEQILARMEPRDRALSVIFDRDSDGTIAPPFLHFPAWYSAVKGGLVDPSAAGLHVELVLFRPGSEPAARLLAFEWNPGVFEWERFGGARYRYFVVRAPLDLGARMFQGATCAVRLTHHVNSWWLYEKAPGCAPGS
jgi:hypothetical protein